MEKLDNLIKEYEERFLYGGILQAKGDILELIEDIGERKFKTMAEIGIEDGGSLWLYANLFGEKGGCFIVNDIKISLIALEVMFAIKERTGINFKMFISNSKDFVLIDPVEFLHIDGDHSYEAIKHDYTANLHMVTPGGLIVLHDTMIMPGAIKFKKELEEQGIRTKTFTGTDALCNHEGSIGTTVVYK